MADYDKQKVLAWYEKFRRQMKETFDIDLSDKRDLVRINSLHPGNDLVYMKHDLPFIRHNENGEYAVPEPALNLDDVIQCANRFEEAYRANHDVPPTGDMLIQTRRAAVKAFEEHHRWEYANQTDFHTDREEDYGQILRIYEDARQGRLYVNGKTGEMDDAVSLYLDDNDNVVPGPKAVEHDTEFKMFQGSEHEADPFHVYEFFQKGEVEIKPGMTKEMIADAEKQNECVLFVREHLPDIKPLTQEEKSLLSFYNDNFAEKGPEEVPVPDRAAFWKRLLTFGIANGAYKARRDYERQKAEWDAKMARATEVKKKDLLNQSRIEEALVYHSGMLQDVSDRTRKGQINRNRGLIAEQIHLRHEKLAVEVEDTYPDEIGCFSRNVAGMLQQVRTDFIRDAAADPSRFHPDGSLTAEGKHERLLKTALPEEKAAFADRFAAMKQDAAARVAATADNTLAGKIALLMTARAAEKKAAAGEIPFESVLTDEEIAARARRASESPAFKAFLDEQGGAYQLADDLSGLGSDLDGVLDGLTDRLTAAVKAPRQPENAPVKAENAPVQPVKAPAQPQAEKQATAAGPKL